MNSSTKFFILAQINPMAKVTALVFVAAVILSGCVSTTMIQSEPSGANVYVDGKYKGTTPFRYKDKKIIFSKTYFTFEKDGCERLDTSIKRNEQLYLPAVPLSLISYFTVPVATPVPLLWVMKYKNNHSYELITNAEKKFPAPDTTIAGSISSPVSIRNSIRLSINPFEPLVNDYSPYLELVFKNKKAIGISAGRIVADDWWKRKHGFEFDDDLFPAGMYNGIVVRAFYKHYILKDKIRYICPLLLYKDIHYEHAKFSDKIDGYFVDYSRSEKAKVYGIEILFGTEHFYSQHIFADFYWGLGARLRQRDYATFYSNFQRIPIGEFSPVQFFPTIHLGIRIGWSFNMKHDNPSK